MSSRLSALLPLVVAPRSEFGSITPVQRLEGILLGLAASIVAACLWPRFPLANEAVPSPPPPPPASPGEMEV